MASWYWLWLAGTGVFGACVGGCELIGRYRDSPFEALLSTASLFYVVINAIAALSAYALIVRLGWDFGVAAPEIPLVQAGVASFGAMAFFRSSLFNVKVGETEIAVGPAILFQILTFATDRAVDRTRGEARSELIVGIMSGVSFDLAKEVLPNFCFELMQNVPLDERQDFFQAVGTLAAKPTSEANDSVKALILGLMLMNVVGKEVLDTAVRALGERIQGPSKFEMSVLVALQGVSFKKAFPVLVECCFVMSRYGTPAEQKSRKDAVMIEAKAFSDDQTLDNSTKVTMLALALQRRVGDAVLLAALAQLKPAINETAAPSGQHLQRMSDDSAAPFGALATAIDNTGQQRASND